jgi:hypothetical protein
VVAKALSECSQPARVTNNETLVRRGRQWFRYDAPEKRLFKQLQKTLTMPK